MFSCGNFRKSAFIDNTVYIGNVSSFITSAASIASRTNLLETDILDFTITGTDVSFKVNKNYVLNPNAFQNTGIKFYRDYKHLTSVGAQTFRSSQITDFAGLKVTLINDSAFSFAQLSTFHLPNCTTIEPTAFRGTKIVVADFPKVTTINSFSSLTSGNFNSCAQVTLINIPLCTVLGNTNGATNEGVFEQIKLNCVINAHASMATKNNGSPDANLAYAINSRGATVNYI